MKTTFSRVDAVSRDGVARRGARRSSWARRGLAVAALAATVVATTTARAAEGCAPAGHFVVAGAEFTDTTTGLVWRRCGHGASWSADGRCTGAVEPMSYAEAVAVARAAGPPWRLPTADELAALLDDACRDPAADPAVMPDVLLDASGEPSFYWTTMEAGFEDMMVTIDFRHGFADMHSKGMAYFVRLVRPAH